MPALKNVIETLMASARENSASSDEAFLKATEPLLKFAARNLDDDTAVSLHGVTGHYRDQGGSESHAAMLAVRLIETIMDRDDDGAWKKTEDALLDSLALHIAADIAAAPAQSAAIASWVAKAGDHSRDLLRGAFSTALLKSCEDCGELDAGVALSVLRLAGEGNPFLMKDDCRARVKTIAERIIPAFQAASDTRSAIQATNLMARLGPQPKQRAVPFGPVRI